MTDVRMQNVRTKFTRYFLNGLIILLPLLVTLYILRLIFSLAEGFFSGPLSLILGAYIPGLGFLLTILIILITGYFASNLILIRFGAFIEKVLYKLPLVKTIYSAAKQVNEILFSQHQASKFRRVVAVEYPRKGIFSMGFLTSDAPQSVEKHAGETMVNVFIPSTPTPATGFTILVPEKDVYPLDMKLEEALKFIVTGGVLSPPKKENP